MKDNFSTSLNEINLYMNDRKANEIIETVKKSDLSVDLNLTTILQRFRGQYHFNIAEDNINKLSMVV